MSLEPVPESEMQEFLTAVKDGRCCVCYGPIEGECRQFGYCHDCDDRCSA